MWFAYSGETLIEQLQAIIGSDDPILTPLYAVMACCFLFIVVIDLSKILISVLGHGR